MKKRRVEIKKIECPKAKMVTFSKRRQGLFKKAAELSYLHPCQIAILVLSPAGNPFVFSAGADFSTILDRYISSEYPSDTPTPVSKFNKNQLDSDQSKDNTIEEFPTSVSEFKKNLQDFDESKGKTIEELENSYSQLKVLKSRLLKCLDAKRIQKTVQELQISFNESDPIPEKSKIGDLISPNIDLGFDFDVDSIGIQESQIPAEKSKIDYGFKDGLGSDLPNFNFDDVDFDFEMEEKEEDDELGRAMVDELMNSDDDDVTNYCRVRGLCPDT